MKKHRYDELLRQLRARAGHLQGKPDLIRAVREMVGELGRIKVTFANDLDLKTKRALEKARVITKSAKAATKKAVPKSTADDPAKSSKARAKFRKR